MLDLSSLATDTGRIFEVPRSNIQGMVYPQTVQHQWALDQPAYRVAAPGIHLG